MGFSNNILHIDVLWCCSIAGSTQGEADIFYKKYYFMYVTVVHVQ